MGDCPLEGWPWPMGTAEYCIGYIYITMAYMASGQPSAELLEVISSDSRCAVRHVLLMDFLESWLCIPGSCKHIGGIGKCVAMLLDQTGTSTFSVIKCWCMHPAICPEPVLMMIIFNWALQHCNLLGSMFGACLWKHQISKGCHSDVRHILLYCLPDVQKGSYRCNTVATCIYCLLLYIEVDTYFLPTFNESFLTVVNDPSGRAAHIVVVFQDPSLSWGHIILDPCGGRGVRTVEWDTYACHAYGKVPLPNRSLELQPQGPLKVDMLW